MVRLEKINSKNIWKICRLHVSKAQDDFVASNVQSLCEAYLTLSVNGSVFPFGIYDDDHPVGFLMIGYDVDETFENPPKIAYGNYSIWRLMIDESQQGKGYGKKALALALEFIRSFPCGKAEYCFLSYEPENIIAAGLYDSFGFRPNGETDGDEVVAVLKL